VIAENYEAKLDLIRFRKLRKSDVPQVQDVTHPEVMEVCLSNCLHAEDDRLAERAE